MEIIAPYRPPLGLPLYWRDEQSGVLAAAINAYLDNRLQGKELTEDQFELLVAWCGHYIGAPCWDHMLNDEEMGAVLDRLRKRVKELNTADEVGEWIAECLDVGLDPL
jgi:hypothetical protein